MNLFDKHKTPLLIEIAEDNIRLIAEIFPNQDSGIVFFDTFWPEPGRHPIHHVKGEITGTNPWKVGDYTIRFLDDSDHSDLLQEWENWQEYQRDNPQSQDYIYMLAKQFGAII